jgi:hypothetical protein
MTFLEEKKMSFLHKRWIMEVWSLVGTACQMEEGRAGLLTRASCWDMLAQRIRTTDIQIKSVIHKPRAESYHCLDLASNS